MVDVVSGVLVEVVEQEVDVDSISVDVVLEVGVVSLFE